MRKLTILKLTLLTLLLVTSVGSSQNKNSEVDKVARKMFVDMNNRDYDAILDMCHPKMFDLVTRDHMKNVFKSTLEGNEEFKIDVPKEIPPYKVSKLFKEEENNLEYAFVSYDIAMKMTFYKQTFDDEAKNLMKSGMRAQGMDVEFISDNEVKLLMKDRITIILKDDTTENKWVMLNYDGGSPIVYQLLPTKAIETAKKYREDLLLENKKKREN